jgi:serine protease Do
MHRSHPGIAAPLLLIVAGGAAAQPAPSFTGLVESVRSSVVNVEVTSRAPDAFSHPFFEEGPGEDFWEHFFGRNGAGSGPRAPLQEGIGSGFIISPGGQVLTNNHVVQGAESIRVKLQDGRTFDAEVLGRDPLTDVALLQLKGRPSNLPVAKLGDSDALQVGEWVVAIGNPFGLPSSVSAGIISARERNIGAGPYDDFLQTDAAINPGNSGGPLFNMRGEVVGINTAIVGGGANIGFAVPSNLVKALLPQLQKEGVVTRGWLGITVQDLTPALARGLDVPVTEGALISEVMDDSPASAAGLRPDDAIVAIDREKVISAGDLTRKVALKRPGTVATLTLYRGGNREQRKATLGVRPDLEQTGVQEREAPPRKETREEKVGLVLQDVDPSLPAQRDLPRGALIVEVTPGSAADRAELQPGMVVVEANGNPIQRAEELKQALRGARKGEVVLLRVQAGEGRALRALTIP